MARVVSTHIDFVVFHTGYASRVKTSELKKMLAVEPYDWITAEPLFAYECTVSFSSSSPKETNVFQVFDTSSSASMALDMIKQLGTIPDCKDGVEDGIVVFSCEEFNEIFGIYEALKDLKYCKMFRIMSTLMAEMELEGRPVRIAYVNVDTESG
jgi:hypothetical protein